MSDWQPDSYLAFAGERTRAARDLLAQVPLERAEHVFDLGCGPGNSTALLVQRFAPSRVTGVDNSPAMLAAARAACPSAAFLEGDLATWAPPRPADLLFSNAALHWVPDHMPVLERLARALAPGGVLAVQMPDNLAEPSHRFMRLAAEQGPWRARLAGAETAREPIASPAAYHARLRPLFRRLDVWRTAYHHQLAGTDGIIAWLTSTGLKPYLDRLRGPERQAYLDCYRGLLAEAYPAEPDGTVLLGFPRLFMVGQR